MQKGQRFSEDKREFHHFVVRKLPRNKSLNLRQQPKVHCLGLPFKNNRFIRGRPRF
jgi:hypothetical protein